MGMKNAFYPGDFCGGIFLSVPASHPVSFGGGGDSLRPYREGECLSCAFIVSGEINPHCLWCLAGLVLQAGLRVIWGKKKCT